MDNNNWRPTPQGGESVIDTGDWRNQLLPDARQRIVNKIVHILKRHLPFSGQEGLNEIKKIAGRFEEKMYTAATSQSDYLRKISLKMLSMESKSQNPVPNSLPSNPAGNSNKPQHQGFRAKLYTRNKTKKERRRRALGSNSRGTLVIQPTKEPVTDQGQQRTETISGQQTLGIIKTMRAEFAAQDWKINSEGRGQQVIGLESGDKEKADNEVKAEKGEFQPL